MPLYKPVLEKYVSDNFVETGTYHGEAVALPDGVGEEAAHSLAPNDDEHPIDPTETLAPSRTRGSWSGQPVGQCAHPVSRVSLLPRTRLLLRSIFTAAHRSKHPL